MNSVTTSGKIAVMRCMVRYQGGAYHPWKSLPSMDGRPRSMDGRIHEWNATATHVPLSCPTGASGKIVLPDKCLEVVKVVWERRDSHEDALLFSLSPRRYFGARPT